MSENLIPHADLTPEIQTFMGLINRRIGRIEPEETVTFTEASYITRKHYVPRYICEITASTDLEQPYNINLWNYVSPICYDKEEYTFDSENGLYVRSGVSAEPDILETVPPFLTEWKTRPATAVDLGRVVGILEYLERQTPPEGSSGEARSNTFAKVTRWILGRNS